MRDTIWKDPKQLARSSISLNRLALMINRVPCTRKTVILNYAHKRAPKRSIFGNPKYMYPPQDCLFRLANECSCSVIGACTLGMSLNDVIEHSPGPRRQHAKRFGTFAEAAKSIRRASARLSGDKDDIPEGHFWESAVVLFL